MALTPYQSEALVKEVDDAVRQDNMMSFWTRYGRLTIGAVILALAAYGGWLFWQNHRVNVAEANSEQFADLLKGAQGATLDQPVYDKLLADGGAGYKSQAQLVKAALAAGKNDAKDAAATYDAIIADAGALQPAKDAALIRKTALLFDSTPPDQIVAALKNLSVPGNAWYGSAGELTAIAYLKMGKRDLAAEMFGSLARDAGVPDSIKLRAGQMASAMGVATPDAAAPALAR